MSHLISLGSFEILSQSVIQTSSYPFHQAWENRDSPSLQTSPALYVLYLCPLDSIVILQQGSCYWLSLVWLSPSCHRGVHLWSGPSLPLFWWLLSLHLSLEKTWDPWYLKPPEKKSSWWNDCFTQQKKEDLEHRFQTLIPKWWLLNLHLGF